jgi:hypothetical protein
MPQAEAPLRKLITQNPKEGGLRAQLIQLYISTKRFDDAERELRATANSRQPIPKREWICSILVSVKGRQGRP